MYTFRAPFMPHKLYSIEASFVAVNNVNAFDEHRTDLRDDDRMSYEVPTGPHFVVQLNITAMDLYKVWDAPPTMAKLVELRRYRTTDTTEEN